MVFTHMEEIPDGKTSNGKWKHKRRDICDRNKNELITKTKKDSFKDRLKRSFRMRSKSEPIDEVAIVRGRKRKLSFLFCSFRRSVSKPKKIVRGISCDIDDEEYFAYQKIPKELHETDILDDVFDNEISFTSDSSRETITAEIYPRSEHSTENDFEEKDELESKQTTYNCIKEKFEFESENDIVSLLTINVANDLFVDDGSIIDTGSQSEKDKDGGISNGIESEGNLNDTDLQEMVKCEPENVYFDLNNDARYLPGEVGGDAVEHDLTNATHGESEIEDNITKKVNHSVKHVAFENDVSNKTEENAETDSGNNSTNKTEHQVVVSNSLISSYNIKTRYFLTKLFSIKNYIWKTKNNTSVIPDDKNRMSTSRDTIPAENANTVRNSQAICNVGKNYNDQCRSSILFAINDDSDQKRSSIIISLNDNDRNHRSSYSFPLHDASARSSFAFNLDDDLDLSELIDYANNAFDKGIVYKLENSRDFGGSENNIVEKVTPLYHNNTNYDSGICRSYEMLCSPNRSSIRESLHLGESEEVLIAEGPDIL